jgi:hypothetical protein
MAKSNTNNETQIELFGGRNLPDQLQSGEKTAKLSFSVRSAKDTQLQDLGLKSYAQLREDYKALGHKGKVLTAMVETEMKKQTLGLSRSVASRISSSIDNGARVERYAEYVNSKGVRRFVPTFVLRPNTADTLRAEAAKLEAQANEIESTVSV